MRRNREKTWGETGKGKRRASPAAEIVMFNALAKKMTLAGQWKFPDG
jgi:hypothetical protein